MLDAATDLFSRKGYRAVSIREIAQRSGVTLSSLYHHFGDKRSLYVAAHLKEFGKSSSRLEAAVARGATPQQRLLSFTTELCCVLSEPGPLFKLVARHWIEGDPDVVRSLAQATVPEQFRGARAAVRSIAPKRDATAMTLSIYAMVHGHITLRSFADSITTKSGISRVPEQMAEFVLNLLLPEVDWRRVRREHDSRKD
jgi:TetR/AcrR family transcriptional regulator